MLLQIMEDEFEAVLEDDSAANVAKDIVRMWAETREEKEDTVKKFEELAEKFKGKKVDVQANVANDDEVEDWEDEEDEEGYVEDGDDAPQLIEHGALSSVNNEPEMDEDGFTLVKGKGKSRR